MVRLLATVAVLVLLWAGGARAQAVETPLETAMQRNPDRFEATMLDLIAGFGGPQGLTQDGIEEHIALERASARASAMRRLMAMDLNADGDVQRDEVIVAQKAASAGARGRMERQFATADGDGDGRVTADEIAAEGKAEAMRALGADEASLLQSILTLDADGNAALDARELRDAMARVTDPT